MLKGIVVSQGYAIEEVFKFEEPTIDVHLSYTKNINQTLKRYESIRNQSIKQLNQLKKTNQHKVNQDMLEIFDAHIQMITDIEFIGEVESLIKNNSYALDYAIKVVSDKYLEMFNALDDDYLKSRALDVKDVSKRLLKNDHQLPIVDLSTIDHPVILAVKELSPSAAMQLNPAYIKGFITENGGITSHSAIIAKLFNIPAIFGIKDLMKHIDHQDMLILDGIKGLVYTNPSKDLVYTYQELFQKYHEHIEKTKIFETKPLVTRDGQMSKIMVNIGSQKELESINTSFVDGIGLFRTEMLFLNHNQMPSFDDQFEVYSTLIKTFKSKPVTIRTLDIGGDKPLSYYKHPVEANPALGLRGIRLTFEEKDIFKTQIKAILSASQFGLVKIMFPMIATLEEYLQAKKITDSIADELTKEGIKPHYELGVMIEVPSAVMIADELARVCDFFSIGSNDLVQYTFASDRLNEKLTHLYIPCHPAILKMIDMVVKAAHQHHIEVSVCGEMAGMPQASLLLLGLGVDTLSMSMQRVLSIKGNTSNYDFYKLKEIAQQALLQKNEKDVLKLISLT